MNLSVIYYDCPKCGKKKSSPDGEQFCGECEEEYRQYQKEYMEMCYEYTGGAKP